jgi:carboxypeptidase PM20D1
VGLLAAVLPLLLVAVARTFGGPSLPPPPANPAPPADGIQAAAARLSRAVQLKTITVDGAALDSAEWLKLHALFEEAYPALTAAATREVVAELSLLYTWEGSDPSLPPVLLLAHSDVVPAEPSSLSQWTHPPFSGAIDGGFVWGRGALDDKGCMMAIMEAFERLAASGFAPRRTLLVALGHDEEIGGRGGARAIGQLLAQRGIKPWFLVDEGGAVVDRLTPEMPVPVALVAVAEKGYLTVELRAEGQGGHSSAPPTRTTVGRLARAVAALEDKQLHGGLDRSFGKVLEALAPYLSFDRRLVVRNLWLFGPIVEHEMLKIERGGAMLRTTTAPTMLSGSQKENVLPSEATATVNFRLMPGDTIESVVAHIEETVAAEGVTVHPHLEGASNPSPVSPSEGDAWDVVFSSVRETFPEAAVVPGLMIAGTDSRHYLHLTENVLRFAPHRIKADDLARFHGVDERMRIEDYAREIAFFQRLMEKSLK